ncbi:hypothetical protein C8F04DRAFT_1270209 [Mycena alexandri]|uniref:Uncharacterized protein n=1 Tax=Mycena alexandri TaxID=1745969 RepID=A0AAD6SAY9_9AGAR|nr:hypothetical protein C8F04DRAFT_1270209 [Mycena alexandri]
MHRRTRQGTQFSPYENFTPVDIPKLLAAGVQIRQTKISLEELFAAAEAAADARAEVFEDANSDDGGSEWEDVDNSRPPTPDLVSTYNDESGTPDCPVLPISSQPPFLPLHTDDAAETTTPEFAAQSSQPSSTGGRAARQTAYNKRRRQAKRQQLAASPFTRISRAKSRPTHRMLPPKKSTFNATEFQTSAGGHWLGARHAESTKKKSAEPSTKTKAQRLRELYELLAEGFEYLPWDGIHPLLILDCYGRIIVAFGGMPEDPEWLSVLRHVAEAMKQAREEGIRTGAFTAEDANHRRGDNFVPLTGGVSFGGGQKHPGNLVLPRLKHSIFSKLIANKYASSGRSARNCLQITSKICALSSTTTPNLQHNFTNSILPAVTFNLGPQSVTFEHGDELNRALGWCLLTSAGEFNPKKSAHLYLKQLKLVVEFPPAASVCLPSAVIEHGNTPLAPHETRYSITQYAAGGLFRWVKYGFQTAKQLVAKRGGRALKAQLDGARGQRHEAGLNLLSKFSDLASDHAACLPK